MESAELDTVPEFEGDDFCSAVSPWQFQPVAWFTSLRFKRLYQSFEWSLYVCYPIPLATLIFLIVANSSSVPVIIIGMLTGLASGVLGVRLAFRWLRNGVDLRQRTSRRSALFAALPAFIGVIIILASTGGAHMALAFPIVGLTQVAVAVVGFSPWWVCLVVAFIDCVAVIPLTGFSEAALMLYVAAAIGLLEIKMTVWYLGVLSEIQLARLLTARTAVAEERARFAETLHDVVGRSLAIISVKSQLSEAILDGDGDPDTARAQALAQIRDIQSTAQTTVKEIRQLVYGCRQLNMHDELNGARVLLQSAGMRVDVEGSLPEKLDRARSLIIANVLREATTNILKHSHATHVMIDCRRAYNGEVIVTNDEPTGASTSTAAEFSAEANPAGTGLHSIRSLIVRHGLADSLRLEVRNSTESFTVGVYPVTRHKPRAQ